MLKALVGCVWAERNPERVDRMLDRIASIPEKESPIREGLLGVLATHPSVNAKRPVRLAREPQGLIRLASGQGGGMQKTVGLVRAALEWPGKVGLKVAAVRALTVEEQGRFESGKQTFLGLCAACHQPTGKGLEGLAPPLADSEWVTGPVERTARIVMHGVRGPLRVKEQGYNLDMPAAGFLSDEQIAGVLTYLRREWGHEADPVSVGEVQRIRKASAGRQDAWTEPELLKIQ